MKYRRRPMTWATMALSVFFLLTSHPVVASVIRYDGPYEGKVINADTGEPIRGAVVLGEWSRLYHHVAGTTHQFYDAVETVTDENGEFRIGGLGLLLFRDIEPMGIVIFKAGYEHFGHTPWESLKIDYKLKQLINWEGNKAIFPLKKWDIEQRKKRFGDYLVNVPEQKQRLLKLEIEKERSQILKSN